jgi:hypothetical protein
MVRTTKLPTRYGRIRSTRAYFHHILQGLSGKSVSATRYTPGWDLRRFAAASLYGVAEKPKIADDCEYCSTAKVEDRTSHGFVTMTVTAHVDCDTSPLCPQCLQ